jgi:phage-related protein
MADREFLLRIVGDVSDAQRSLGKLEGDVDSFKGKMETTAKIIGTAFAVGAAVEFGKGLVDEASKAEQAIGAVNSVFGEYADVVHESSKSAAQDVGLATSEYEQLATLTGALLKGAGVPLDEVAKSAQDLTKVGADLSAMYGGTAVDAMGAINSALKGEMDPLEAFGVSLKASTIEAKALKMGLVDSAGKVTEYGKKMATIALIQEQAADSAGQFARESGSVSGQTQIMKAQFANLQASLGQQLLPVVARFAEILTGLIGFVSANQDWLVPTVVAITGLVLAIKAYQLAQAAWIVVQEMATVAQLAFNAAMAMNPIGLIVIAIAALIAGLILAYKKVDWFREGVDAAVAGVVEAFEWVLDTVMNVYNWVKQNWPLLLAIITGPFGLAVYAIAKYWDDIKRGVSAVIDSIKTFFQAVPGHISSALSNVWNTIKWPFEQGWDVAKQAGQSVLDWFASFPDNLARAWYGLDDVIFAPFKAGFNAIKSWWNSTVGGFSFNVPSWVPGVGGKGFSIPKMAKGGIVTRPTIALLGEAGREAVIPLSRMGDTGPATVILNVYALTANAEVGRKVFEALREYERSTGRTISAGASGVFAA